MSSLVDKLATADQAFKNRMAEMELTRSVGKLTDNRERLPEGNHRIVIADIITKSGSSALEFMQVEVCVEASRHTSLVDKRFDLAWILSPHRVSYGASRAQSFFAAASAGLGQVCDAGFITAACGANSLRGVVLDAQVENRIARGLLPKPPTPVHVTRFSPVRQTPQAVVRRRVILDPTTVHAEAILAEAIALNPTTPDDQAAEWMTLFGELIKQIPDNATHQPVGSSDTVLYPARYTIPDL